MIYTLDDVRVDTIEQYEILYYLRRIFNTKSIQVEIIDDSTLKCIDSNGATLYYSCNKDHEIQITDENGQTLDAVLNGIDKRENNSQTIKELENIINKLEQRKQKLEAIWKSDDFYKANLKRTDDERHAMMYKYYNELDRIKDRQDELRSNIRLIEFDTNRKSLINYLKKQMVYLDNKIKDQVFIVFGDEYDKDPDKAKEEVDKLMKESHAINRQLQYQAVLRKIVGSSRKNMKVYYLDYSSRTTLIMDEFENSHNDFFMILNVMRLGGESEYFSIRYSRVSLIVSQSLHMFWDPHEYKKTGITMSEIKRCCGRLEVHINSDNMEPEISYHNPTNPMVDLIKKIAEIYIHGYERELIYNNIVLFKNPYNLKAQTSDNYEYEGYGRSNWYHIIGVKF